MLLCRLSVLGMLLVLGGCVSNVDQKSRKIDKKQAIEAHIQLGLTYLQKGERDRALRAFTDARGLDARVAEATQGIALVHQLNGELEQADKQFKKALKLKPLFTMSNIEISYAQFLYESDRCDDAKYYLAKARTDITFPNRSKALYMLGLCAKEEGDEPLARGAFEHALNLNSSHSGAAMELADIHFEQRDYSEAKKYLDVYTDNVRQRSARSLWLGIKLERIFGNKDKEASYALALRNLHPYSKEYLEYKRLLQQ